MHQDRTHPEETLSVSTLDAGVKSLQDLRLLRRGRNDWSFTEDRILVETYTTGGVPASVENLPGRTEKGIISRAKRLGLSRALVGRQVPWRGSDIVRLKKMWPRAYQEEIQAAFPGRRWITIQHKATLLRLKRKAVQKAPRAIASTGMVAEVCRRINASRLTLTELDRKAQVSNNTTGRWFGAKTDPKFQSVENVIRALGGKLLIVWNE